MSEVTHEKIKSYGTLSVSENGWTKEFNLVSWNGAKPKYDLRDWSPDGQKMSKGITLNLQEVEVLKELLGGMS